MRQKYPTTTILVRTEVQRANLLAKVTQLPLDSDHPIEVLLREYSKPRKLSQNALMWSSQLKDISEQAYIGGRTYDAEVWHEYFKKEYLPTNFDAELTKDGYTKFKDGPSGEQILVGSTTELTVKGFSGYLEKVMAYGATLGVIFNARDYD